MSILLDAFCRTWSLIIPVAHLLSNWRGVGPCVSPISSSVMRHGIISFAVMNPVLFSASCAEDMTASIILEMTRTWPLGVGVGESNRMGNRGLLLRYIIPVALERTLDLHK